jgi:hypothetical protein
MTKNEFYKQWLEHFAVGIPPKDLKKYVVSTGNLIWHTFIYAPLYCSFAKTPNPSININIK